MIENHDHARWDDLKRRLQQTTLAAQGSASRDWLRKGEIYRQRALQFAARTTRIESSRNTAPVLVFTLGDQRLGIPLAQVAQVYPACALTPVPRTPSWVLGIGNFESQIRSVIDLAALLELSSECAEMAGNILLLRCAAGTAAARVERVDEVQNVDFDQLVVSDEHPGSAHVKLICGATPEHLLIISVDGLLAHLHSPASDLS